MINIGKYLLQALDILKYKIKSFFYSDKDKYKNSWLICERGTEAKDNGFCFFRYLRDNHPEINAFYIIDKNSNDYNKVKQYGNIIDFQSDEHKIASFFANNFISTHTGYVCPWSYPLFKLMLNRGNKFNFIFLQHGITKDDLSGILNKRITGIDLFITATKPEQKSILTLNYGYKEKEVPLTGFARFDFLTDETVPFKKKILFMPTWRSNLVKILHKGEHSENDEKNQFLNSDYYKLFNSFLSSNELSEILDKNNIDLIFYPHYEIQRYLDLFSFSNEHIIIASKDEYDVQELFKTCNLLITDYSSVFFDFCYLKKPVIYYQFDSEEFFSSHYRKGYFSYEIDGFGKIVENEKELFSELKKVINRNFLMEPIYEKRVLNTFSYFDSNNCNRIYDEIKKL